MAIKREEDKEQYFNYYAEERNSLEYLRRFIWV